MKTYSDAETAWQRARALAWNGDAHGAAELVDLEALGLFEWMRDADLRSGLQNSLAWAEVWRARQQCRIAVAAMQRAAEVARATFPGQLSLAL